MPDSSFFCCTSLPKTDGQVFTAADVAPHQGFGFQAALQRLGTTRNLSGKLNFSTRRGGRSCSTWLGADASGQGTVGGQCRLLVQW